MAFVILDETAHRLVESAEMVWLVDFFLLSWHETEVAIVLIVMHIQVKVGWDLILSIRNWIGVVFYCCDLM